MIRNKLITALGGITPEKPTHKPNKKAPKKPGGGGGKPPKKNKPKSKTLWKTRLLLKIIFSLLAIGFIFAFLLIIVYGHDLPNIDKLYDDKLEQSVTILDYKGNTIATYGDYFTEFVQYKDLPKTLVDAVVATEDRRFFDHWGVDPRGMLRAIFTNLTHGKVQQGGSTITQQLAKIVFLKPERKLKRKVQEAMLALWLEKKFTKQQIITMYLNRVYLGGGVYGVDAAAHKYFNKSVKKLNLYESAMIAGLLKAPTTYSPANNPHLAAERTEQVLLNMVDDEKITDAQMKQALKTGTQIKIQTNNPSTKYYTDFVIDQVQDIVGKAPENLIVKTAFRPDLQALAETAISKNILEFSEKNNAHQAALVSMKPNGAIVAIIGGVDYTQSQFNRATQAERQPGSSFKLFVYTAAMMYGKRPDDLISDEPITIGKWRPQNYDGKYHGMVTLHEAFAHSYNAAAANLAQEVGIDNIIFLAKKMGIKSPLADVPSIALGSSEVNLLELTNAFAHMANNGNAVYPYAIEQIKTQTGRVVYTHDEPATPQIIDEDTLHKMNDLLTAVVTEGTARSAQIGRDVGGKTGTSQDFHDAWFIGFTPQLVTGVWVGNDDNAQMKKVTGGSMPARIWAQYMKPALAGAPVKAIDKNYGWGIGNSISNFWDSLTGDEHEHPHPQPFQHPAPPEDQAPERETEPQPEVNQMPSQTMPETQERQPQEQPENGPWQQQPAPVPEGWGSHKPVSPFNEMEQGE